MNVPAQLLDNMSEELFSIIEADELTEMDYARLALMANSLRNMAQDLRGDGNPESSRRRQMWWQG